jgi:hypothetical protein
MFNRGCSARAQPFSSPPAHLRLQAGLYHDVAALCAPAKVAQDGDVDLKSEAVLLLFTVQEGCRHIAVEVKQTLAAEELNALVDDGNSNRLS